MHKYLITTSAIAVIFASGALAEDTAPAGPIVSGEFKIDIAETAAGDYGATTGLDLGIDAVGLASVDLDFILDTDDKIKLDDWGVGTSVGGAIGVSLGTDQGVMPGAEGEQTLAAPAMGTAVKVEVGDAAVAVGFTDMSKDITDVSNIQGAYSLNLGMLDVTAAGDYNMDSENFVLGAGVGGLDLGVAALGGAMTYDVDGEEIGYEIVATTFGVTAYLNGDSDEALQNVGGEYSYMLGGAEVSAGAAYNFDAEEFTPTVGVGFSF
jgi:hypothetical protein